MKGYLKENSMKNTVGNEDFERMEEFIQKPLPFFVLVFLNFTHEYFSLFQSDVWIGLSILFVYVYA